MCPAKNKIFNQVIEFLSSREGFVSIYFAHIRFFSGASEVSIQSVHPDIFISTEINLVVNNF